MADQYRQIDVSNNETHFEKAPTNDVEFSRMTAIPRHLTTFNGGDIVPIYCREVLPGETLDVSMEAIIRQTTLLRPVFGELFADVYAFFVPNRVVNESWVNVQGENTSGAGIAPDVALAPLYPSNLADVTVPVGSVADYYGFPTQKALPHALLARCNDLKFRGYLSIYNEFFRDQNYQPPIAFSKANVYEGFFQKVGSLADVDGEQNAGNVTISKNSHFTSDGSFPEGALLKAIYGEGFVADYLQGNVVVPARKTSWSALDKPLKANKLHDFFTSVLPFPQKGLSLSIMFPSDAQVFPASTDSGRLYNMGSPLHFGNIPGTETDYFPLYLNGARGFNYGTVVAGQSLGPAIPEAQNIQFSNLQIEVPAGSLGTIDIANLRTVIATQSVFETLSRAGSRYREVVQAMFSISADDPYRDIPEYLGHVRRTLNNYQVAQTSPSAQDSTPQANLAAFSYTATSGQLFQKTFLEHGYVHILCVVRQKNVYSSILWQDNFRRSMLDFYLPPLANISEQPVRLSRLNPWAFDNDNDDKVLGYQEAWSEYRYEPDLVSGKFRAGLSASLSSWLYLDEDYSKLNVADGAFMRSNAEESINPTLAVSSELEPQFFAEFVFKVDKTLPMPVYSVPGLDIF